MKPITDTIEAEIKKFKLINYIEINHEIGQEGYIFDRPKFDDFLRLFAHSLLAAYKKEVMEKVKPIEYRLECIQIARINDEKYARIKLEEIINIELCIKELKELYSALKELGRG